MSYDFVKFVWKFNKNKNFCENFDFTILFALIVWNSYNLDFSMLGSLNYFLISFKSCLTYYHLFDFLLGEGISGRYT